MVAVEVAVGAEAVLIPLRETILFGPRAAELAREGEEWVLIPLRETILFGLVAQQDGPRPGNRLNPS